jgi:lipopolysaccharide transport system ATP-binding protein
LREQALLKNRAAPEKPAIVVNHITKEFIIPHERKTTLFESVMGAFRPSTYETFTALKDVSFTVQKGESIGIIGDNGSGKSTILKVISKILRPTRGSVEVNGRITPFLELGVGFQQDLTARENIEVYSTIMGLSDREIARNMDSVLEFAGLAKFADTKLKNFSSGMQVRLAFATAIQREPDILLVDEVLAVGDMDFQRKCLDIFQQYKDKKVTILYVSHDLSTIRRFCDKAIMFDDGRVIAAGNTDEVIDQYIYKTNVESSAHAMAETSPGEQANAEDSADSIELIAKYRTMSNFRWGNKKLEIRNVRLLDKNGNSGESFVSGDPMEISMEFMLNKEVNRPVFGFDITNERGEICYGTNTLLKGIRLDDMKSRGNIRIMINELPILQGKYYLSLAAQSEDNRTTYDWHSKAYPFYVMNKGNDEGFIRLDCDFEIKQ